MTTGNPAKFIKDAINRQLDSLREQHGDVAFELDEKSFRKAEMALSAPVNDIIEPKEEDLSVPSRMPFKEATDIFLAELEKMTPEEFESELKKHGDGLLQQLERDTGLKLVLTRPLTKEEWDRRINKKGGRE